MRLATNDPVTRRVGWAMQTAADC